jgi:hypothetical protein
MKTKIDYDHKQEHEHEHEREDLREVDGADIPSHARYPAHS